MPNQLVVETTRVRNEQHGVSCPSGVPTVVYAFHDWTGTVLEEIVGSVNSPNYRAKLAKRELLPQNSYSKRRFSVNNGLFKFTYSYLVNTSCGTFTYRDIVRLPYHRYNYLGALDFTPDWSEVTLELYKKLKNKPWQAGVSLGEARQTADLIMSTTTRMADAIRSLRRGRFGDFASHLGVNPSRDQRRRFDKHFGRDPTETASRTWLEYSFGWVPLIKDVEQAAQALATALHKESYERYRKVTARVTKSDVTEAFRRIESSPERYGILRIETQVHYRMMLMVEDDVTNAKLRSADLLNPVSTAWELVPWSFLIDYFSTIGDVLSILDVPGSVSFIAGTSSYRVTQIRTLGGLKGSNDNFVCTGGPAVWKVSRKERGALGAMPPVPFPSFQDNLNPTKVANGIALLAQQFEKLRYRR